ncbi:MAG TPA: hypothetical protein VGO61_20115 [Steroidobacteraceae bacterium]|nr:hypothetical protein [Steroidobacteraceae bacterium]
MATKKQQVNYFAGAMTTLCEVMCTYGITKETAKEEFKIAIDRGYAEGKLPLSRETRPLTSMADLCKRWHFEKAYVDKSGKPRPLTWNGRTGSLLKLAERIIGKKDARTVIEGLITRKLLRRTRDGAWLPKAQVVAPSGLDSAQVLRTATMLERLLRTVAYNSERNYRGEVLLEVLAQVPRLPARYISAFKKFSKAQGLTFVLSVDDWLESRNIPRSSRKRVPTREVGVIAFAFEQSSAST